MLKRIGLGTLSMACVGMCAGCSLAQYFMVTGSIVNTGIIAGVVAGAAAIPTLLGNLRGIIPGL